MIITYHGAATVKVSHGEWLAVFNPPGRAAKFVGDLALISFNDPAYNHNDSLDEAPSSDHRPLLVDGPGEYERSGAFIRGFGVAGPQGKPNTIFDLTVDGKRLTHLGILADKELPDAVKDELMSMDILFVSIGQSLAAPRVAYQLASDLNPRVIIPVHYTAEGLAQFLKEAGGEAIKPVDKLVVKGRELAEKEAEVMVLASV